MTGPKLDDVPSAVAHAVAEALGDAYDCTRVWSAWRHGTMGPSDFYPVADDGDRVAEIALAAINAWEASKPQPATVIDLKKIVPAEKKLPELYLAEYHENKGWNACRAKMLTLIDGQANNLNEQFGNPEELPPAIDLEQFIALAKFGEAHAFTAERRPHSMTVYSQARHLLALIDGQGKSPTQAAWTDEQCAEFLAVAMRHVQVKGTLSMDEIRQGQARANAMQPTKSEEE